MKRSNFTIKVLIAISFFAISVVPALADFSWSGNAISITEFSGPTGLSTICNAKRNGYPMGGWTSTAGVLPQIVAAPLMTYELTLKTVGLVKIEDVVLTPDSGVTGWKAKMVANKGYTVDLPLSYGTVSALCKVPRLDHPGKFEDKMIELPAPGLPIGEMSAVEWRVKSRDKHNKLILVVIPISWDSTRTTCVGSSIMVQVAPDNFASLSNLMVFGCLRGFVPAWATVDPALLMQQQLLNGGGKTPTGGTSQPDNDYKPPKPTEYSQPPNGGTANTLSGTGVKSLHIDGHIENRPKCETALITLVVRKDGEWVTFANQSVALPLCVAKYVEFRRGDTIVCMAQCAYDNRTKTLNLEIYRGNFPGDGDILEPVQE